LHDHHRADYGSEIIDESFDRWAPWFAQKVEYNFSRAADHLSPGARGVGERLLADFDQWLPEFGEPTLVHGDLWATNIIVDDADPDRPRITAFIDGGPARFCEVEYELAYLRCFSTADATFFEHYTRQHPLRDGFDRRCRVYWFNTILLHVWMFGDEFLARTEQVARELDWLG
jgi:fructosamine-3-kinase